jgi:CTP synthase
MKTKPTQYASRTLNGAGIQADIIVARSEVPLDDKRKEKISWSCSVDKKSVISAPDVESIYHVPINFERDNLSNIILKKLDLRARTRDNLKWEKFTKKVETAKRPLKIGIVGKYFETGDFVLSDAYISVIEALKHASYYNSCKPELAWLDSTAYETNENALKELKEYDGIVVPGGFGSRGIEGKINVAKYCRENKIPYFGLCYGMQIAVIEFARNVANIKGAQTAEIDDKAKHCVIDIMPEQKEKLEKKDFGGSMRLGAYIAKVIKGTIARNAYKKAEISERHRHRYEVNPKYVEQLSKSGLVFSATSPDGVLMEIAELPKNKHPFYLATQFHPEFQSSPLNPHPLFMAFVKASKQS